MTTSNSRTSRGCKGGGDVEENELDDEAIIVVADDDRKRDLLSAAASSPPRPALSADARCEEHSLLTAIVDEERGRGPPFLEKASIPKLEAEKMKK